MIQDMDQVEPLVGPHCPWILEQLQCVAQVHLRR